jgi:hypothetical protein
VTRETREAAAGGSSTIRKGSSSGAGRDEGFLPPTAELLLLLLLLPPPPPPPPPLAPAFALVPGASGGGALTRIQLFTLPRLSSTVGAVWSCRHCPSTINLYWCVAGARSTICGASHVAHEA